MRGQQLLSKVPLLPHTRHLAGGESRDVTFPGLFAPTEQAQQSP